MSGLPNTLCQTQTSISVRCVRALERVRDRVSVPRNSHETLLLLLLLPFHTPSTHASAFARGMFAPVSLPLLALLLWPLPRSCQGGMCWSSNKNGRCHDLLQANVSREVCCASKRVSTAWTAEDLDSGALFYWTAFGGGVPNCSSCRDSCKGAECSQGKQCMMRNGQPQCVCFPECTKAQRSGPVCGTDAHTYRNHCALLKKACRRKSQLQMAYSGPCQRSCEALRCPGKKQCILDQNMMPHCVRCSRPCPRAKAKNYVCGTDGVTYSNLCYLRQAACQSGRAIPVAYQGKCKAGVTCDVVRCPKGKKCLSEPGTKRPRCTSCDHSCKAKKYQRSGRMCGSDNQTYTSWCAMMQESCRTGVVIEPKSPSACEDDDSTHEPNNIPLLDQESSTKS